MIPVITAFAQSPDRGRGLARDMRVRWALEEVGQPYEVRLVSFRDMKEPSHRALHPFGQIPTYEKGDLVLFETGAIVLHIAEQHPGLLPEAADAKARAKAWMFAALGTMELPILELATAKLLERDKPWTAERLSLLEDRIRVRLTELSICLGEAEWLAGAFSGGDLLMAHVLLRLSGSGLLDEYPNLFARAGGAPKGTLDRDGLLTPAQRGVVRHRPVQAGHPQQARHLADRLPQRQAEQDLEAEAELDGSIGEGPGPPRMTALGCRPLHLPIQPNQQQAAPAQRGVVGGPVRRPVAGRRTLAHAPHPDKRSEAPYARPPAHSLGNNALSCGGSHRSRGNSGLPWQTSAEQSSGQSRRARPHGRVGAE